MRVEEKTFFALHSRLDEEPSDWETRLVLADALEEAGRDDEARLQRWLVEHRKRPGTGKEKPLALYGWSPNRWYVFNTTSDGDWSRCVGYAIWDVLRPYCCDDSGNVGFPNRHAAEAALLVALRELGWPTPKKG